MASSSLSGVELKESPEGMVGAGISLSFPVNELPSPSKLPRRLRHRLSECRSPATVEEIEAKLKEAPPPLSIFSLFS